jgi:hypothetical protein
MFRKQLRQLKPESIRTLEKVELKVFSQFGEDGIIQCSIQNVEIPNKKFGVENFKESNEVVGPVQYLVEKAK